MITEELKAAYHWHRNRAVGNHYPRLGPNPAAEALAAARADVAAGKKRYASSSWAKQFPAVGWSDEQPGYAYVQSIDGAGLRFVGRVTPESYGGRDRWDTSGKTGWYTDPFGEGWNLCYGVVYQLPARNGKARFVAGYDMAEDEGGLVLDFGTIYESDSDSDYYPSNRNSGDGTKEAAYAADEMARVAAEREKEYQTAWQAGSAWADEKAEIAGSRATLRQLLAERRQAKAAGQAYPTICATIESAIRNALQDIRDSRAKMEKLAAGDVESLYFYPSPELRDAFNEGAGETVLA